MGHAIGGQSVYMAQLPTQSQFGDYSDWPGRDVLDSGGQRLGGVREIYLDRETGRPEWVLVDVTDSEARFVPLANADVESWSIRVAHDAEKIRSAPGIGAEPRIDQSEERRLYAHYGLGYSEIDRGNQEAPPAPTGWGGGGEDTPSWQARGGDSPTDPAPTADAPSTPPWRTEAEPTNDAPPPAEPPSPAEIESAQIAEEPPASSDRASDYETAPFGAVAPPTPTADDPGTFASTGDEDPPAGTFATTDETSSFAPPTPGADESAPPTTAGDVPSSGAGDPAAAFLTDDPVTPFSPPAPEEPGTFASTGDEDPSAGTFATTDADEAPTGSFASPTPDADERAPLTDDLDVPALTPHAAPPDLDPPALAVPIDEPSTLTPPTISHGADSPVPPPVTADKPVADDTPKPSWASTPPPLPPEPAHTGGALEKAKRSPGKIAVAGVAAAVLFFIVRRLR